MLLQRGNFTINNINELENAQMCKDGLRKIIDLSYMGQVEYEGNTIPLSRMIIEYNKSKYQFYYINIFNNIGEQMIVYANSKQVNKIIDWYKFGLYLIERNYSMYEHVNNSQKEFGHNFWWNVYSDYFVFFGEEKKEIINYFINGCYEKDGGKEMIRKKLMKCWYKIDNI